MEKKAYDLVKALKYFMVSVIQSHIIAYLPDAVVNDMLTRVD